MLHKIANLAKLEIKPAEEEALMNSLENVLSWMEQLNEIDTSTTPPLTHISAEINVLRDDTMSNQISREQALYNAPDKSQTFFKVPKVIE